MPGSRRVRAVAAALALALTSGASLASAESLQDKLNSVKNQMEQNRQEAVAKQTLLQQLQNKAYAAQVSYNKARNELEQAKQQLSRAEGDLAAAEQHLRQTEAELVQVTERLKDCKQRLGERMRSLYMDGRVEYLDVLLGATSFSDFLSRFRLFQSVVRQDSQLLSEVKQQKALAEMKRAEAERQRNHMIELRDQAQRKRDQVAAKVHEVAQHKKELDRQQSEVRRALDQLDRESRQLEKIIRDLEERIARELGQLTLSPPVKPPNRTSGYGMRWHPILKEYRKHSGVDFAASTGQNVYAAADGTVIVSGWQSGYGNVVVISHGKVNGKAISTLYAHNSKLKVTVGQKVKRGAVIALAGSTGMSTGPHCHFEVRVDGVPTDPAKWLGK